MARQEGPPTIVSAGQTGEDLTPHVLKPGEVHNFHFLRQDVFPITLLNNEPPTLGVFNAEQDPTPKPTIAHAVRYVRRVSEALVDLPSVPPKKNIKDPKAAAVYQSRREEAIKERRNIRNNAPLRVEFKRHATEVREALGEIKSYMDVATDSDVFEKLRTMTVTERSVLRKRINEMFLNNAGISFDYEITGPATIIAKYARKHDSFWAKARQNGGVIELVGDLVDLPEEVKLADDILTLIEKVYLSENPEVRYRAAVKLLSMKMYRNINAWRKRRELIEGIEEKSRTSNRSKSVQAKKTGLTKFLIDNLWREGPDATISYITTHETTDKDDYTVTEVKEFPDNQYEVEKGKLERNNQNPKANKTRLHSLQLRTTIFAGRPLQVNITDRHEKDEDSVFIKMMRTGEMNPEKVIKDEQGAILVVRTKGDARRLMKRIREASRKSGKQIEIYDVEDHLDESVNRTTDNPVSSTRVRMLKFRVKLDGEEYEAIIHTLETKANYDNADEYGHGEYEINRWFGSGRIYSIFLPNEINTEVVKKRGTDEEVYQAIVRNHRLAKRLGIH